MFILAIENKLIQSGTGIVVSFTWQLHHKLPKGLGTFRTHFFLPLTRILLHEYIIIFDLLAYWRMSVISVDLKAKLSIVKLTSIVNTSQRWELWSQIMLFALWWDLTRWAMRWLPTTHCKLIFSVLQLETQFETQFTPRPIFFLFTGDMRDVSFIYTAEQSY